MMTRKNYQSAAEIVREMARSAHIVSQVPDAPTSALARDATAERDGALEAFITLFSQDNPAFDRKRFREACEYVPGVTCAVDDCSFPALPKKGLCAAHAEPADPTINYSRKFRPSRVSKPARFVGVKR